ncbi:MAG: glycoside hydrolase family 36 N-terminal domain-containing protein [Anaerobutyricum sp.]
MSLSLDLPDQDYVWMQLSGAWARERYIKKEHWNRESQQLTAGAEILLMNTIHLWFYGENIRMNIGEKQSDSV